MNKWFRLDSPLMMGLSRMADMVYLSVLWFVCCLPVITIGASTTAMYYVTLKTAREEDMKITTAFFQAFKKNFKQATALNLISLVVGIVLLLDCWIMLGSEGSMGTLICAAFFAMFIWLLCIMFYAYPLQAQFYNTVKQTLINAAILSMRKFPTTVIVFVLNMLPILLGFISLSVVVRTAPVWILLMPGLAATVNGKLFAKLFDPFLKAAEEPNWSRKASCSSVDIAKYSLYVRSVAAASVIGVKLISRASTITKAANARNFLTIIPPRRYI